MSKSPRQHLITLAKLLLGSGLLAWLLWQATQGGNVEKLLEGEKNWWLFAVSALCIATAVVINFVRWLLIVHAAGLPMTLSEAFRLGALGHAANFVGPGSVGGDLLKAVLFARNHQGRRSAAVATVLADRFLGLLTLLLLAAVAAVTAWSYGLFESDPQLQALASTVIVVASATWLAAAAAFLPGPHARWLMQILVRIPMVGLPLRDLFAAVQTMHTRPANLPGAILLSCISHVLLVFSFIAVGHALPLETPDWLRSFAAIPLAELAGAIPLFPGGLGATEGVLNFLYETLGAGEDVGTLVAIGQRLVNISVGAIALVYYLAQRNKLEPAVEEAEAISE